MTNRKGRVQLHRETVKRLSTAELGSAAGGSLKAPFDSDPNVIAYTGKRTCVCNF